MRNPVTTPNQTSPNRPHRNTIAWWIGGAVVVVLLLILWGAYGGRRNADHVGNSDTYNSDTAAGRRGPGINRPTTPPPPASDRTPPTTTTPSNP